MVINAYLKKQENPQTLYFRELQREKKNEVQNQTVMKQKTIEMINETKIFCIKNINKIDKPLGRLTEKKRLKYNQK